MQRTAAVVVMMLIVVCAFGSGNADGELTGLRGIRSVTIKAQFLDVDLVASDSGRLDMALGPSDGVRIRHEQTGSHLEVWVEKDWPFGGLGGGTLRLRLPRPSEVHVETISGHISARGLTGGTCDLKTVSGGIQLHELKGGIKARTVSGSIIGDGVDFVSDSSFASVSGRVEISTRSPLESLRFDVTSLSGRITVGSIAATRGLRMGFTGPLIRAQTVSGSLFFK